MSTPIDNRFALDAAAVVQQLSREIATFQARAVAQRALIAVAAEAQRSDLSERAATEVQIYEETAARLLQTIQRIVSGGVGTGAGAGVTGTPSAASTPPGSASKTPSQPPPSSPLTPSQEALYRVATNARNVPHKRHEALVQLLVHQKPDLNDPQIAELRTAHTDIQSKWSGLLALAEQLSSLTLSPGADEASVRRSDQIRRVQMQLRRAAEIVAGGATWGGLTDALCDEYRQHCDAAVAVLSGLTYRSEESVRAEAVIAQLRRLRDDCDVTARLQ